MSSSIITHPLFEQMARKDESKAKSKTPCTECGKSFVNMKAHRTKMHKSEMWKVVLVLHDSDYPKLYYYGKELECCGGGGGGEWETTINFDAPEEILPVDMMEVVYDEKDPKTTLRLRYIITGDERRGSEIKVWEVFANNVSYQFSC